DRGVVADEPEHDAAQHQDDGAAESLARRPACAAGVAGNLARAAGPEPDLPQPLPQERPMAIVLYYGSGSPFAWRVQLALEHKSLPYERKVLSFSAGDTRKPE